MGTQAPDASDSPDRPLWLVDAYNVLRVSLSSEVDASSWWKEPRRRALTELALELEAPGAEIVLVFDGTAPGSEPSQSAAAAGATLAARFEPSADEWIVRRVKEVRGASEPPREVVVVTADRPLANRCKHHGARVVSTGDFVELCR